MVLNTKFINNLMSLTSVDRISNYSGSACGAVTSVALWTILRPVIVISSARTNTSFLSQSYIIAAFSLKLSSHGAVCKETT